jgi:hypothetical protein
MLDIYLALSLSFLCGFLVKAVDYLEDEEKSKNPIKYVAAAAYGLIIGLLISASSFSLIFIAALLAQFVSKKVDTYSHYLGCLVAIVIIALSWSGSIYSDASNYLVPFIVVLAMAILDELSDGIKSKQLHPILRYRPFLKAGSLIFLIYGRVDYFFGIISFDIGYELFNFLFSMRKKASKRTIKR